MNHPNVIKLKEMFEDENKQLSFVFEYIPKNVYQLYDEYKRKGETLPNETIKSIFY